MQELALSEGALPRHLHTSLFTISADQRMLTNRSDLTLYHFTEECSGLKMFSNKNKNMIFLQAAESSPGGTLDGREPRRHEPPEKDPGEYL